MSISFDTRVANQSRYSEVQVEHAVQVVLDRLFESGATIGYEGDDPSPLDVAEMVLTEMKGA